MEWQENNFEVEVSSVPGTRFWLDFEEAQEVVLLEKAGFTDDPESGRLDLPNHGCPVGSNVIEDLLVRLSFLAVIVDHDQLPAFAKGTVD